MLIVLAVCMVIASIVVVFAKKNKESFWLMGLCISLLLEICGIMLFIAKKGGVSTEVMLFFFFSKEVKNTIQYMMITLNQMGYLLALGRILFPFFLIRLAIGYSMIPIFRRNKWISAITVLFPVISLVLYSPWVYRMITSNSPGRIVPLNVFTVGWIIAYIGVALVLLVYEYWITTLKFSKRQVGYIMMCLISLSGIYLLFFRQDPGQIYYFYNYSFKWSENASYMQVNPSLFSYMMLLVVSIVCCILGFASLFHFTAHRYENDKADVVMERKFDAAKIGVSTFVHSMKNQLLASKVIYKRIGQLYETPEPDAKKLKEYVDVLEDFNNTMLTRMEELYRCVKSNVIYMIPTSMDDVVEETLLRFHKKYPEAQVKLSIEKEVWILSDKTQLCEALYNLLINAQEAVVDAERGNEGYVELIVHRERQYTVIKICDNGLGIGKYRIKKIFEPFYSSKNSNSNWGMGLYYVREIVKSHLGSLHVESKEGEGSVFYILLPKYDNP